MTSADNPVPDRQSVVPYLMVRDSRAAIDFYVAAFGARERVCMALPDGRIAHAEIELSGNQVWLADEVPELGCAGPATLGGAGAMLFAYVADVDDLLPGAVAAGAVIVRPLANQFWGDRTVTVRDPFGHVWTLATRVERMSREEALARAGVGQGGAGPTA